MESFVKCGRIMDNMEWSYGKHGMELWKTWNEVMENMEWSYGKQSYVKY